MSEDYGLTEAAPQQQENNDVSIDNKVDNNENEPKNIATNVGCCGRCRYEWRQPLFSVEDYGGKILDVQATFAPSDWFSRLGKLICWGFALATTIRTWYIYRDYPAFYMAFLTYWTGILSILYLTLSLLHSFVYTATTSTSTTSTSTSTTLPLLTKITWLLFAVTAHLNLDVTILFWYLDFDYGEETVKFRDVASHGGTMIFLWFEGLIINRIPIRCPQVFAVYFVAIAYVIWTVVHGMATNIGNPNQQDEDPDTNDDLIYGFLDWEGDAGGTAIMVAVVLVVLVPVVFVILRTASLISIRPCGFTGKNRRYVSDRSIHGQQQQQESSPNDNGNVYELP